MLDYFIVENKNRSKKGLSTIKFYTRSTVSKKNTVRIKRQSYVLGKLYDNGTLVRHPTPEEFAWISKSEQAKVLGSIANIILPELNDNEFETVTTILEKYMNDFWRKELNRAKQIVTGAQENVKETKKEEPLC